MKTIEIDGEKVTVNIKPSDSRRAVDVDFKPGEITIGVPHGHTLDPDAFIKQHLDKITQGYQKAKAKINILEDDTILIHGHRRRIAVEETQTPPDPPVTLTPDTITIHAKPLEDPNTILKNWITAETRRIATETLEKHANRLPEPQIIRIRDAPRWGQCNKRGEVVLNWQLATLPPELAEYITIHEALHQKHLNHKNAFHTDLEKILPNHRELEKKIDNYLAIPSNFQFKRKPKHSPRS